MASFSGWLKVGIVWKRVKLHIIHYESNKPLEAFIIFFSTLLMSVWLVLVLVCESWLPVLNCCKVDINVCKNNQSIENAGVAFVKGTNERNDFFEKQEDHDGPTLLT